MIRPSFNALMGIKSLNGAYEEVIPTSSQNLSKLNLERLKLVRRTCFVHKHQ